jgi:O-Antigen ligase
MGPPLARAGLGPPLVACAVLAASAVAGWNVARGSVLLWAPVLLTLLALYISMRPETLFVCWLFAAPFVQESARETTIGGALTNVLYVLPLGVFLLHMSRSNVLAQRLRWYDLLPLGYVAFIIGSQAVVDVSELRSPSFYTSLLHGGILVGVAMYYLVAFGPLHRVSARHVAITLLSSSSIIGAMGIVEHFTHWSLWGQGPVLSLIGEPPRIVATLSNPAVLGAFLGAGIVMATAVLVWEGPPVIRRFSLVTLALTLPALFFTYTRAPMIAAVAVASVLIAMRRRIRVIGALVGLAAVLLVWSNWAEISSSSLYEQRAANVENVQGRLLLSKASLDLAAQRPLLGWGYGQYDEAKARVDVSSTNLPEEFLYYYTSHNTFLTILVELGGAGLVVFLLPWIIIVCLTFRRLGSTVDSKWFTLSLLGILMVYVLTALTIDMRFFSFVPALAWIAVGLLRRGLWDEPSLE